MASCMVIKLAFVLYHFDCGLSFNLVERFDSLTINQQLLGEISFSNFTVK